MRSTCRHQCSLSYFTFRSSFVSVGGVHTVRLFISLRSHLTSAWTRLFARDAANLNLARAWQSGQPTVSFDATKTLVLNFPSRVTSYTMSRGATVRKKMSREQTQSSTRNVGLWFSLNSFALIRALLNPVVWVWTLRDVKLLYTLHTITATLVGSALSGVQRVCTNVVPPVLGFILVW